jgi:hypothetical protein
MKYTELFRHSNMLLNMEKFAHLTGNQAPKQWKEAMTVQRPKLTGRTCMPRNEDDLLKRLTSFKLK